VTEIGCWWWNSLEGTRLIRTKRHPVSLGLATLIFTLFFSCPASMSHSQFCLSTRIPLLLFVIGSLSGILVVDVSFLPPTINN
jgi:hypothetical protein